MSIVTLFADASYNDQLNSGGGGFWAKGGQGREVARQEGSFPIFDATCSGTAEALAVLMAAEYLMENPHFHSIFSEEEPTLLVIVTDCLAVVNMLNKRPSGLTRNVVVNDKFVGLLDTCDTLNVRIKSNHVPGHKGNGTPRTYVNELCDKYARKGRRRAEDKIKAGYGK